VDERTNRELIAAELGSDTLADFDAALEQRGLDPAEYNEMPVHPRH